MSRLADPPRDPDMPEPERHPSGELTILLRRFTQGDSRVGDVVMRTIQAELRRIASRHMRKERKDHTLQTTALVNEAYLRLMSGEGNEWNDRNHFFAVASSVMRQILVDYAR